VHANYVYIRPIANCAACVLSRFIINGSQSVSLNIRLLQITTESGSEKI